MIPKKKKIAASVWPKLKGNVDPEFTTTDTAGLDVKPPLVLEFNEAFTEYAGVGQVELVLVLLPVAMEVSGWSTDSYAS